MQVEGQEGLEQLWTSALQQPGVLYRGALAQAAATAVGHFPWFLTYNFFDAQLPIVAADSENAMLLSLADRPRWDLPRRAFPIAVPTVCVSSRPPNKRHDSELIVLLMRQLRNLHTRTLSSRLLNKMESWVCLVAVCKLGY